MRPLFPQRLLFCALVWALSPACVARPVPSAPPNRAVATALRAQGDASLNDARDLARALPKDAERCTVVLPSRVALAERPLLSLVSQVDRLPWALRSQVSAYARAELTPRSDRRRMVELIRFANGSREQIRRDLTQHADRKWTWGQEPVPCNDMLTCFVARAQFVDERTVRITTGDWPYEDGTEGGDCLSLLEREPSAIEVSARRGSENPELGGIERVIVATSAGIERIERRAYGDASSAQRAQLKQLTGYHDLPLMAGVPVSPTWRVEGHTLAQRSRIAWEDLWLVVQDQERLRAMLTGTEPNTSAQDEVVDVQDVERVRAHVDMRMASLSTLDPAQQRETLLSVRDLLQRARVAHAQDEGLARRLFALELFARNEPRAALLVAEAMIKAGSTQAHAWELSRRQASAHLDEASLKPHLMRAHDLSPGDASKMASVLARAVRAGQDYERAEWAFLLARSLAQRAHAVRFAAAPSLSLSPGLLVRSFAALAVAAAEPTQQALGIHVLIFGNDLPEPAPKRSDGLWVQRTEALGTPAIALAATSWDAPQVLALCEAIDALAPSAGELWVGFDPLHHPGRPGTLVRLSVHRDEQGFVLDRVSKNVSQLDWPGFVRKVAEPLSRLHGSVFPPDALNMEARTAEELAQWSMAAARVEGVSCSTDGLRLACQGTLHDGLAAERTLRAIVRTSLAPEVRIFTSGVE